MSLQTKSFALQEHLTEESVLHLHWTISRMAFGAGRTSVVVGFSNPSIMLEVQATKDATDTGFTDHTSDQPSRKISLVDGMVQKLSKKTATVVTFWDLSGCFNDRLMQITHDEIILVFDTYRVDYLKSATGDKRRQGKASIQYQVRVQDDPNIRHIPMSRFLSHDKTKADLTCLLNTGDPPS